MRKTTLMFFTLTILITAVILNGCSGSSSDKSYSLKTGKYVYTLTDSSGKTLVEGEMLFNKMTKQVDVGERNYLVEGSYTITKPNTDTSYTCFSTMTGGELTGYYNDSLKFININTNPKIADANVFLNGNVNGTALKGTWNYSTFRGTGNEAGMFKANYIKNK